MRHLAVASHQRDAVAAGADDFATSDAESFYIDGRPLLRAYSMASANHEEELEFFCIKVADGPLTSRLQQIKEGDTILVGRKATGTLIADNLIPGKRLLLLSTGTGLAPFASLIKDPEVYERFESIVLVHGCRQVSELAYGEELVAKLRDDELFGPLLPRSCSIIRP